MACLNPRRSQTDDDGVVYYGETENAGIEFHDSEVACNRCHLCRARQKRDTAIRCVHEAEEYTRPVQLDDGISAEVSNSCFVTLTFDGEHLPEDENLRVSHWQGFMQALRNRRRGDEIRYLACGEYGSLGRPHYHGILFGVSFHEDRVPIYRDGSDAFSSAELDEIWGKGRTELGPCSYPTAAYVAGYAVKKAYGEARLRRPYDQEPHTYVKNADGSWRKATPEWSSRSTGRGDVRGLGFRWIERNYRSVYAADSVRLGGNVYKPPRYYDKVCAELDPGLFADVQRRRQETALEHGISSSSVLRSRKAIFEARLGQRGQTLS